jgi:hypothetical protein
METLHVDFYSTGRIRTAGSCGIFLRNIIVLRCVQKIKTNIDVSLHVLLLTLKFVENAKSHEVQVRQLVDD